MPSQSLDSLAHALSAAASFDDAVVALAESVADIQSDAEVSVFRVAPRSATIIERRSPEGGTVAAVPSEVALGQLPPGVVQLVERGLEFADVGEESATFAAMLGFRSRDGSVRLSLCGVRVDRELVAIVAILEPAQTFGVRVAERAKALGALFAVAVQRFVEREARTEATQAVEEITQRLHSEYLARLGQMEVQLSAARAATPTADDPIEAERRDAKLAEEQRRNARRLAALEHQLTSSIGQLEQAHVELHRRSETLRQRTRTLYLIDRLLSLATTTAEPMELADGLLALVGDDLQALRCSLFLVVPDNPEQLYLATFRGLAPHVTRGSRIWIGEGVAGRVAKSREPLLMVDSEQAAAPLLGDSYLTTGSFISFPLIIRGELIGVVNLANRAQRGLFVEEDVERVRLLGLVISLVAHEASLARRLIGAIDGR
ncbi:MAG: GAF domain-containing protein [Gemmatimonadetes bacterium]|nr:GAF domain-containing protein [Gemmatimonadota bacterium]